MTWLLGIARMIGVRGGLLIAAVALLVWLWIGWNRAADQRDEARDKLRTAEAAIVLLEHDAALKELAAIERQNDIAATAQTERELNDAIAEVLDSKPDPVSVRLGCERLRRAGTPASDLPADCRSPS